MEIIIAFFNIAAAIQLKLRNKYEILMDLVILIFHKKGRLIKLIALTLYNITEHVVVFF
jgi:hypothetical protein